MGIADIVKDGPKDVHGIAERLDGPIDKDNLLRVLKFLASNGVFSCDKYGRFGLTSLSSLLCTGPTSLAPMVLFMNGPEDHRVGWSNLQLAVEKGGCGFEQAVGKSLWEFYDSNPNLSQRADRAFASGLAVEGEPLVQDFDWSNFRSIVDVGGGEGGLLIEILKYWPILQGQVTVFDRKAVIGAQKLKESVDVGVSFQAGDFFEKVEPSGKDAYVLKHILHDWNDLQSISILKRVRQAMTDVTTPNPRARILLIDVVLEGPDDPLNMYKTAMDINMLAMCPGRERTIQEWNHVLIESGMEIVKVYKIRAISSIIEARVVDT